LVTEQLHDLFLAKTQFTEAITHFRRPCQFLDANHRAGLDFAQRANSFPGAFAIDHRTGLLFRSFAHRGPK
jgi:hypothetical protein